MKYLCCSKKTCREITCVVEEKTHERNMRIANAKTCKENSNVVEEKNTHKNNITSKMSFYDWSLLLILYAYAIYSLFRLVIYVIFSCLSTCSCIGPIIKWHFWHNGTNSVLFKEKKHI
jgi:hypothetical protein